MQNRNFKDTVTYWAPTGKDVYGATTFAAPVTYSARWEEKAELFRDKSGEEVVAKVKVHFFDISDLDFNGYLYLGESVEADPKDLDEAYEIRGMSKIPDLRNLKTLTVVFL